MSGRAPSIVGVPSVTGCRPVLPLASMTGRRRFEAHPRSTPDTVIGFRGNPDSDQRRSPAVPRRTLGSAGSWRGSGTAGSTRRTWSRTTRTRAQVGDTSFAGLKRDAILLRHNGNIGTPVGAAVVTALPRQADIQERGDLLRHPRSAGFGRRGRSAARVDEPDPADHQPGLVPAA